MSCSTSRVVVEVLKDTLKVSGYDVVSTASNTHPISSHFRVHDANLRDSSSTWLEYDSQLKVLISPTSPRTTLARHDAIITTLGSREYACELWIWRKRWPTPSTKEIRSRTHRCDSGQVGRRAYEGASSCCFFHPLLTGSLKLGEHGCRVRYVQVRDRSRNSARQL